MYIFRSHELRNWSILLFALNRLVNKTNDLQITMNLVVLRTP